MAFKEPTEASWLEPRPHQHFFVQFLSESGVVPLEDADWVRARPL